MPDEEEAEGGEDATATGEPEKNAEPEASAEPEPEKKAAAEEKAEPAPDKPVPRSVEWALAIAMMALLVGLIVMMMYLMRSAKSAVM